MLREHKKGLLLIVSLLTFGFLIFAVRYWPRIQEPLENHFEVLRVAHAGGGIDGWTYTNSFQALDRNIAAGFIYFEIDFSFTRDQKLVCIHDWNSNFQTLFGFTPGQVPSFEEFVALAEASDQFESCTLDSLAEWMRDNPSAVLVTDIKDDNIVGLGQVLAIIPNAKQRVIPQVYQPGNYNIVKDMGYESVIWTLYRFKGEDKKVIRWVNRFSPGFAVTMPEKRAMTGLARQLGAINVPTYVHTINDAEQANDLFKRFGVSEIYTDFLIP